MDIKILEYIKLIQEHHLKKKIEDSVRPMTFSESATGYYWLKGTGFFIQYGHYLIFLSARHNFTKKDLYVEDNYFSDLRENIENFFIIKNLHLCDLKDNNERIQNEIDNIFIHSVLPKNTRELEFFGLADEDLNDIAIITFTKKFSNSFLNKNSFIKIDTLPPARVKQNDDTKSPEIGDIVFVSGHCVGNEDNKQNYIESIEMDDYGIFKKSEMTLNRNYIIGKIIEKKDSVFGGVRYFNKVKIIENFGLKNLSGFSGSPVFLIKNNDIKFTGMIIQGKGNHFSFINIDFIRTYLMMNNIGIMQLGLTSSSDRMFNDVKNILDKHNIQIIDKDEEKEALSFELNNLTFIITYKYMCHIFVLKILLKNIDVMTNENFHLLADICFHIRETDKYDLIKNFFDKISITESIIVQLKEKYIVLIEKGKKFSYDDIFDIET